MEYNYTSENFQPDDDIVLPQDDLYSLARETETNPSLLDHPYFYSDPITIEHTEGRDSVTQQSIDGNITRQLNNTSHSIAAAAKSDTH